MDEGLVLTHPSPISATLYAGHRQWKMIAYQDWPTSQCEPVTLPARLLIRQKSIPALALRKLLSLYFALTYFTAESKAEVQASVKMNFPFFGPSSLLKGLSVDRGELCHCLPLLGGNY